MCFKGEEGNRVWITKDLDLPEELLAAQQRRELVVFAGAGVSIDDPSGMPSFPALIRQIAAEHGDDDSSAQLDDEPDFYLGQVAEDGFPVHARVAEILTPTTAANYNAYHVNLLRLFREPGDVRLVTTNHDPFFTSAAEVVFPNEVESFYAPALPPGDEFVGIAYLHGGVVREANRLVLTDSDFGRAYLIQGWAATFLRSMYARFAVLFVGYRHGEPVLKYLARGLTSSVVRYAFDRDDADTSEWSRLGIHVVAYPRLAAPDHYGALREGIVAWAERTQMGFVEHDARIRALAQGAPPLDRADSDYLKSTLREAATSSVFATVANDPAWLIWARDVPQFAELFAAGEVSPAALELAQWFAQSFVPAHSDEAISSIQAMGGRLSSALWIACAWRIWTVEPRPHPDTLGFWVAHLLENNPPPDGLRYLEYILSKCRWPEDRSTAVLLFAALTDPRPVIEPTFVALAGGGGPTVSASVETAGDQLILREVWERYFAPHLDVLAIELEPILAAQLVRAHSIMRATGQADDRWDPTSFLRYRIEE